MPRFLDNIEFYDDYGVLKKITDLELNINLENAEGLDSLVQKWTPGEGEPDATHYPSTCTGESSVVLGEANENTESRTFVSGKMNRSESSNSIIGGLGNGRGIEAQGSESLQVLTGDNLLVGGLKNQNITSDSVILGGQENTNRGSQSIIGGYRNTNNGPQSIIGGGANRNNSSQAIMSGYGNVNNIQATITGGLYNINSTVSGIVAGRYNNSKSDNLLELGNGTSDTDRHNAFEVTKDGIARSYGAPVSDNDIVRLKELNEAVTNCSPNINLENAEGLDSLVQKWTPGEGEPDATHYASTCTGESSVVLGEANSNTKSRTLVTGKMNRSEAGNSIIGGLGNGRGIKGDPSLSPLNGSNIIIGGLNNENINESKSPDNVILSGDQNKNTDSKDIILNGYWNKNIKSDDSIIGGRENTNTNSPNVIISGRNNTNTDSNDVIISGNGNININGDQTLITGLNNNNEGVRNIISGGFNTVEKAADNIMGGYSNSSHGQGNITGGKHNKNITSGGIVAGIYNNGSSNALLELGNGESDDKRANAFTVYKDGNATVQKTLTTQRLTVTDSTTIGNILTIKNSNIEGNRGVIINGNSGSMDVGGSITSYGTVWASAFKCGGTVNFTGTTNLATTKVSVAPVNDTDVVRLVDLNNAVSMILGGEELNESLDTIKEIQEVLAGDTTGAAGLIDAVSDLQEKVYAESTMDTNFFNSLY